MAYDVIKKNVYFDPPNEYPHSSRNHAEDFADYHLPLARLHHSAVHDRGIAAGLEVSGAPAAAQVTINPGVAVDGTGQMIVLSTSGQGDIGDNPPAGNHNAVPVPVALPLGTQSGKKCYITIQFSTINRVNEGSGGRLEQVPWIRLQPTSGAGAYVDDGSSVILGIVDISGAGTITTLAESDGALPYGRRTLGEPASELRVRRSLKSGNQLTETLSGRVTARTGGGLQLTVPNSGDTILLSRDGGTNCASVETHADTAIWKDGAGRDVVHIDAGNAWMRIGAQGNEGDLVVQTQNGQTGFAFDGSECRLDLGGVGTAGHLFMRDNNAGLTAHIDGGSSSVNANNLNPYNRDVIDVGARFFRIHGWDLCLDGRSGGNKRALVDANQKLVINWANDYANGVEVNSDLRVDKILRDGGGVPLMGNPARKVAANWDMALNTSIIFDVDIGYTTQFFAFGTQHFIYPVSDFDDDNCSAIEIYKVDGNLRGTHIWDDGDRLGPAGDDRNIHDPYVVGVGRVITFRIRAIGPDLAVAAAGIVFYE